jgi:hypothetical protein
VASAAPRRLALTRVETNRVFYLFKGDLMQQGRGR